MKEGSDYLLVSPSPFIKDKNWNNLHPCFNKISLPDLNT